MVISSAVMAAMLIVVGSVTLLALAQLSVAKSPLTPTPETQGLVIATAPETQAVVTVSPVITGTMATQAATVMRATTATRAVTAMELAQPPKLPSPTWGPTLHKGR